MTLRPCHLGIVFQKDLRVAQEIQGTAGETQAPCFSVHPAEIR
jgi:hypothetical protein